MTRLTVGILGLGGAGRAHARRFQRNPHVGRVVAYDVKPEPWRDVAVMDDLDAFFGRIDAVSICTPDRTHLDYIVAALERGLHVLVEKPMVSSAAEAVALEGTVQRHPRLVFAVHHQMRSVPAFARAKRLIDEGALGRIFYIEANYWHDMRTRNLAYDDWRVRDSGQSVIFGAACHPLDLVLHLVGRPVDAHSTFVNKNAFTAYPAPYTAATTLLRFDNDVVAKCHVNNCAVFPQMNNLLVLGDQGTLIDGILHRSGRFRDLVVPREVLHSQSRRRHWRGQLLDGPLTKLLTATAMRLPLFRGSPFSAYNHELACRHLVDNFVDAIVNGARVLVPYADGRRVIELCETLERDAAPHADAPVPFDRESREPPPAVAA